MIKTMTTFKKIRNYKDAELIELAKGVNGYKNIPSGYWILAMRNNADTTNVFDDKAYIMQGNKCLFVTSCTTNSGSYGLLNFGKWNKDGVAVIKSNDWYYDVYRYGLHKGKMEALRQVGNMKYYRDKNKDGKINESGKVYVDNYYTNFHANDYTRRIGIKTWLIGGWSVGCIVCNDLTRYYAFIDMVKKSGEAVSLCLVTSD